MNSDKKFYIIAGCNGAGKTTASKRLLPGLINCSIFINADQIAFQLNPENEDSFSDFYEWQDYSYSTNCFIS